MSIRTNITKTKSIKKSNAETRLFCLSNTVSFNRTMNNVFINLICIYYIICLNAITNTNNNNIAKGSECRNTVRCSSIPVLLTISIGIANVIIEKKSGNLAIRNPFSTDFRTLS